jgi:hypothetical protein
MRHNTIIVFLFGLSLLAFGAVAKSVNGQEAPSVRAGANAPGWITVYWEHTGVDVYYFVIERQDAPYTDNSVFLIAKSGNRTDSVTDKNLQANTLYKYHVCAVYADSRTCSDWVSVRTLTPPPSPGGSSGSAPPPKHQPIRAPDLTATTDHPFIITLHWGSDQVYELKNVQLYRDGEVVYDAKNKDARSPQSGAFTSDLRDSVPRANTKYKYKVCFISLYYIDTKCSEEITASGKPFPPTAPANVTVSQDRSTGNPRDLTARIRTFITARWRNTPKAQIYIPGQFITLEREDKVQLDRLRVGPAWVELKQISADHDPTEVTVDTTPEGPELLTQRGKNYRVCAVLPALGAAGKVCSETVSTDLKVILAPGDSIREKDDTASVFRNAANENALAARGEVLASAEPLAAELRNQQPEGPSRRGFYIGMAAAEGQTLPGPGKQKIHDSLDPAEQKGFDAAVSFSLERNRNADLAAKGAAIANADPIVAQARTVETDVFYRLGFDIASGIFGNPALGARGNTATGPGSLGIRDSLSAAGQRGFNASVKLHLSRNYKP